MYPVLWSVGAVLSQGRGDWSHVLEGRAIGFATDIAPDPAVTLGSLFVPTTIISFITLMKVLIASQFQELLF